MRITLTLLAGAVALSACTAMGPRYSRIEAIEYCQQKTREASGVTGTGTVGASSSNGPFIGLTLNIPITGLQGLTPDQYFNNCMDNLAANGQISEGS
jgi:hypothetical protein